MKVAIDWSHKEEKLSVYDGKKIKHKLPKPSANLIIITENMPPKMAKPYLDTGGTIFRCSTHETRKYREQHGIEKTDDNDCLILWQLYETHPEKFYQYRIDQRMYELRALYATFKQIQKLRTATGNRTWHNPDSEMMQEELNELQELEKSALKKIRALLKEFPIYTEFLKDKPGLNVATAAGLIGFTEDIRRFANHSCIQRYFGLDVRDGKAPKKQRGQEANWHHRGRALLIGVIGDQFIKLNGSSYTRKDGKVVERKPSEYRQVYDEEKQRQLDRELTPIHAHNRAKRKAVKHFLKDYFQAYKRLADHHNNE